MQNEYSNKIKEIDHLEKRLKSADKQNSLLKEALRQEQSAKEIAEHNANSLNKVNCVFSPRNLFFHNC